jgi:hypothetical protein
VPRLREECLRRGFASRRSDTRTAFAAKSLEKLLILSGRPNGRSLTKKIL